MHVKYGIETFSGTVEVQRNLEGLTIQEWIFIKGENNSYFRLDGHTSVFSQTQRKIVVHVRYMYVPLSNSKEE
jgi:hypothetical protein